MRWMFWRLTKKQFALQKGEDNRLAMKSIVESVEVPGIIAYHRTKQSVGVRLLPEAPYSALSRSRILQPIDDLPCWSVACLFIDKSYRKKGLSTELLSAASGYAKSQGAELVEGYPVEPKSDKDIHPAFAWTVIPNASMCTGFKEVVGRSPAHPMMRIKLK